MVDLTVTGDIVTAGSSTVPAERGGYNINEATGNIVDSIGSGAG